MHPDSPALAHHFDDLEQQHEAGRLGMWVFLITEVMIFGGLFTAYAIYRWSYPEAFLRGSNALNWILASINTLVLISSSFTMALAVYGAETGKRRLLIGGLLATMALGVLFLVLKGVEYAADYQEGLIPGRLFNAGHFAGSNAELSRQIQIFLVLYFCMTGLHAVHMIIGLAVLAGLTIMAWRDAFTPEHHPQVELMGLYWHFVDVVWIFLLPLLYLVGTR